MTNTKFSAQMFDAVCKAVANEENWEYVNGTMELKWSFVDADVVALCTTNRTDWAEHYNQFEAACDALEAARGEVFPTKENRN